MRARPNRLGTRWGHKTRPSVVTGDDAAVLVANGTEVRHRRFCTALGCRLSTDGTPEANARDLRNLLHLEHRVEDRIAEGDVFDRVLGRRHGPGDAGPHEPAERGVVERRVNVVDGAGAGFLH